MYLHYFTLSEMDVLREIHSSWPKRLTKGNQILQYDWGRNVIKSSVQVKPFAPSW